MNLHEAQQMANDLIEKHLPNTGYYFAWSKKKTCAGTCSYRRQQILLSKPLTEFSTKEETRDTILHEIAHAITGPFHGHDAVWKKNCLTIGAIPKACYDSNSKPGLGSAQRSIAKYKAVCINGHEHFLHRFPKGKKACGTCSRRYDERFILNFEPNI